MSKNLGIGIFAYNRPSHLKRVLFSILDNNLYNFHLFIDGPKNTNDLENKKTINFIAKEINKKKHKISIHNHKKNLGLKKSILYGADLLSKKYQKFIIIEDDCVIYNNFFKFMKVNLNERIFNKYNIGAVYGFQFNQIQKYENNLSSIISNNFVPWGWGTLSFRWKEFRNKKYKFKKTLDYFNFKNPSKNFWSKDFIIYNYNKNLNYISPTINLVKNIGFDGTGINSTATSEFNTKEKIPKKIQLNNISFNKNINLKQKNYLTQKAKFFY